MDCIYEKPRPSKLKEAELEQDEDIAERLDELEERSVLLHAQFLGMQYTMERLLAAVQNQHHPGSPTSSKAHSPRMNMKLDQGGFPALPGYRPPPYQEARYGIVAKYEEDAGDETLPGGILSSPTEALQGLTLAALKAEPMEDDAEAYELLRWVYSLSPFFVRFGLYHLLLDNLKIPNQHHLFLSPTSSLRALYLTRLRASCTRHSCKAATSSYPSSTPNTIRTIQ